MSYLICDKCSIYYEIKNKEEMEDFHTCECGKELKYYETMEEYMNEPDNSNISEDNVYENEKGSSYAMNKKDILNMEMEILKGDKETEERERLKRDINYKINHSMAISKENSLNNSKDHYEPLIAKELEDEKKKEELLKEMELLKEAKGEN